ncbi:MAG TPA: DUF2085 domain-containing protein [Pyrinomonadaceae bacterium]|nr:DUF2085 domain-containing protein [Pyrinomonadaceae bacterium]
MLSASNNYIPQTGSLRRPLLMWVSAAAASLALISLIIGAPLALEAGHPFLGLIIYRAFSHVCHQIPERSFFVAGHHFAVCSRCTGLYAGFAAATVVYPVIRSLRQTEAPASKWLFMAAAPLALDFSVGYLGIWENTQTSRCATGALLGAVAVLYVMPGLMDLSLRNWVKSKQTIANPGQQISPAQIFSPSVSAAPSDYSAPHRRI